MKTDILKEKFNNIIILEKENSFLKVEIQPSELLAVLKSLQNIPEFSTNMLTSIICIDLGEAFELIYDLYSTTNSQKIRVSIKIDRNTPTVPSVIKLFKSAYFDECEIFDMFGVNFSDNPNLKRLYMPKGWVGHPMRKDYELKDERLEWNND